MTESAPVSPIAHLLGVVGRFAMAESIARQLNLSLEDAAILLEETIDPTEEVSFASMIGYIDRAVEGWRGLPADDTPRS